MDIDANTSSVWLSNDATAFNFTESSPNDKTTNIISLQRQFKSGQLFPSEQLKLIPFSCLSDKTGRAGSGRAGSGRAGSGRAGSGRAGSGRAVLHCGILVTDDCKNEIISGRNI